MGKMTFGNKRTDAEFFNGVTPGQGMLPCLLISRRRERGTFFVNTGIKNRVRIRELSLCIFYYIALMMATVCCGVVYRQSANDTTRYREWDTGTSESLYIWVEIRS